MPTNGCRTYKGNFYRRVVKHDVSFCGCEPSTAFIDAPLVPASGHVINKKPRNVRAVRVTTAPRASKLLIQANKKKRKKKEPPPQKKNKETKDQKRKIEKKRESFERHGCPVRICLLNGKVGRYLISKRLVLASHYGVPGCYFPLHA